METLTSPFARKLKAFVELPDEDLKFLSDLHSRRRTFPPKKQIIHPGQRRPTAYILADGWVSSYKSLPNGKRQIVDFRLPGDFLGFHSAMLRTADHYVVPITKVEASEIESTELLEAISSNPRLGAAILWSASRDEALVVEHLVSVGRRNAIERIAHLFLELSARLRLVGMGEKTGFSCPISQQMIADALGMTAVNVNRVLRELRVSGLMTFHHRQVEFLDLDGLIELAEFDRSYLDQDGSHLKW